MWSQSLRWTIASALKDLILTVGALTKSGKMECDSRNNGGNFVRKLTFFCWLVHVTDIFPPLGHSLHPNNHCDIPGKIWEIEYRGQAPAGSWDIPGFFQQVKEVRADIHSWRIGIRQSPLSLSVLKIAEWENSSNPISVTVLLIKCEGSIGLWWLINPSTAIHCDQTCVAGPGSDNISNQRHCWKLSSN